MQQEVGMAGALKISQAASLALHAMALLAGGARRSLATREIAKSLRVSENHLSKVLQNLTRAGLLESMRGPKGGFRLARRKSDITLLMVYEAVEGPLRNPGCLLGQPACQGDCVLGGLVQRVSGQVRDYLAQTTLGDLAGGLGPPCAANSQ
jgi:Rrf2 family transcriptional regulator, nitric oxide-sensitive transcriptional repressor